MAATMSSPWSKPGAWALDAEEHEAELRQQENSQQNNSAFSGTAEFPSLASAAATKQPKKKKNQTLSLAEFSSFGSTDKPSQQSQGLTHEELLNLPTGPRQRSSEELERSRLGGGFKSYGLTSYRNNNGGDESSNSRWGNNSNNNSRVSNRDYGIREPLPPSRADEIDDWSKGKKSTVGNGYDSRRERERGSFFESQSKADESDSWVSNKPAMEPRRFGATTSGSERRGSFDSLSRERPVSNNFGAADSDNWGRKREDSNGTGVVGTRPKLMLKPRSVPVNDGNEAVAKPKGSNPFGDARPREKVLEEQGKDYKEIDEKLDSMKISKDVERGDGASFGRRGSFGHSRGGTASERVERDWRKPDGRGSGSRPQSAETTENGHAEETGLAAAEEN